MTSYRYIYDQFSEIVDLAETISGITCFYQFGPPSEILDNLRSMTQDPKQVERKYPLIALFADYPERQGIKPGIESDVSLHLIIATLTDKDYTSDQRIAINIKPILEPLYDALMSAIDQSGYYHTRSVETIPRTKTVRFSWGRNGLYDRTGNVFEEMIDCSEIENLELSVIKFQNC